MNKRYPKRREVRDIERIFRQETINGSAVYDDYRKLVDCNVKRAYSTVEEATNAIAQIKQRHNRNMQMYRCNHCGWVSFD